MYSKDACPPELTIYKLMLKHALLQALRYLHGISLSHSCLSYLVPSNMNPVANPDRSSNRGIADTLDFTKQ